MLIVRASVGLLADEESQLQRQVPELERSLKETQRRIEERKREPEFWVRKIRSELADYHQIKDAHHASLETGDLLSLPEIIQSRNARYQREIALLDDQLKDFDQRISIVAARVNELAPFAAQQQAAVDTTRMGTDIVAAKTAQLEVQKSEITSCLNSLCRPGNIAIRDCSYVQQRLDRLDSELREVRRDSSKVIANRDQTLAGMEGSAARIWRELESLQSELLALQDERRRVERAASGLDVRRTSLGRLASDLDKWQGLLGKSSTDSMVTGLVAEELRLSANLNHAKVRITNAQEEAADRVATIREAYDNVVQAALSPEFRGILKLADGVPEFSILHGTVLAGEAIDSLSILLADLTCMLLGVAGKAFHPGLLIHDSPREADLGHRVYASYVTYVAALHAETGGAELAPFQYFLTTTTAPPAGLRSNALVCLKLSSEREEDLLFRRRLGQPPPDDQGLLPFDEDE